MADSVVDPAVALQNPVTNGPCDSSTQYFVVWRHGPVGELKAGCRPSESFTPIPKPKKGKAADQAAVEFEFDLTGERREVVRVFEV